MKVIKPQRLGILSRSWEHKGEFYFTVSVLVYFPFESPSFLLPEVKMWQLVGKEVPKEIIFDEAMPKPNPEVLISGHAYPPGGNAQPVCAVRVKLGSVDKKLYAIGNRTWTFGGMSKPEPFTKMPITWPNAFGGAGFAQNPLGKGSAKVKTEAGQEIHELPNIEDPRNLIKSPDDTPQPAGFGGYDITWPQRASKFGTYDRKWLKERFPGFADDVDLTLFNVAPKDQHCKEELRGDEPFQIENMHPELPNISSRLPGVRGRCFLTQKTKDGEVFREVPMRLDTVHLFPHVQRGALIFRGTATVDEDDAADVTNLIIAAERIDVAPKPLQHYRDVLRDRLDKKRGALLALKDDDLIPQIDPPEAPIPDAAGSDMDELVATKNALERNLRNRMAKEKEKVRADLVAMGLNPDEHMPKEPEAPKPPTLDKLVEYVESLEPMIEDAKKQADAMMEQVKADIAETCKKAGLDYEKTMAKARKSGGGPPKFSAKKEMDEIRRAREHMKAAGIEVPVDPQTPSDEEIEKRLIAAEEQLTQAYWKFAHHFPEAEVPEGDAARVLRDEVIAAYRNGTSLEGRDLTGVDLSHLDLSGINLDHAMLECANFTGTNLADASLQGAVLARANLTNANLSNAKLLAANLGRSILVGAKLVGGIDLKGATLMYADLSGAFLDGAKLDRVDLFEAKFVGASFRQIEGTMLNFMQSDLSGISFAKAQLSKCNFIEVKLDDVDFSGATMPQCVFIESRGERTKWGGVKAENTRMVKNCAFPGAQGIGAVFNQSNCRGTNWEGADFSGAQLKAADFSECNMSKSKLYRATAIGSLFVRTDFTDAHLVAANFMQAILQKTKLAGANFRGANLFRADLARSVGDNRTSFDDALVDQVRHVAARKGGAG